MTEAWWPSVAAAATTAMTRVRLLHLFTATPRHIPPGMIEAHTRTHTHTHTHTHTQTTSLVLSATMPVHTSLPVTPPLDYTPKPHLFRFRTT